MALHFAWIKRTLLVFTLLACFTASWSASNVVVTPLGPNAGHQPSDDFLKVILNYKIATDPDLLLFKNKIKVESYSNTVIYTGSVPDAKTALLLVMLAASMFQTESVDISRLKIYDDGSVTKEDIKITGLIMGLYIRNFIFSRDDFTSGRVMVSVDKDVVTLTGTARSAFQVYRAIQIAKGVRFVKQVISKMEIQ